MFCSDISAPIFFFFSDSVPSDLLYYSHLPTVFIALLVGFFVYFKNPKLLAAKLLLGITVVFSLWAISNLIVWVQIDSRTISFFWSLFGILYSLLYIFCLYFYLVFLNKDKDILFLIKSIIAVLFLPVVIFSFSTFNIKAFDIVSCEAIEGFWYESYYYFLGLLIFFWILFASFYRYGKARDRSEANQIIFLTLGMEFFLLSFFISSYVATVFDDFELEQYGLFGMTFFMGVLGFLIVKFKAFDIKLIGAQALIVAQFALIGSMFFFAQNRTNQILLGVTLFGTIIMGRYLIRSMKKEIKRKEELQEMSDKLAQANDELRKLDNAKSEFISIASHQLRTPLTAIKGFLSLILEGSYGTVSSELQEVLNKVYASNERIVQLVENLLNISRIESGRIQYQFEKSPIETLLKELSDMFFVMAKNKKLTLTFTLPKKKLPLIYMDAAKIREVISNLIDNAFKYTAEGGIEVILEQRGAVARITVADTGMGVEPETIPHLFSKFIRGSKEASRMNVAGTGLGLYVGRSFIEAHHGKIWIESEGKGKGSRFIIELPIVGE